MNAGRKPSVRKRTRVEPCQLDTSSVVGLTRLVRARPRDWRNALIERAPRVHLHPGISIGEVIGTVADLHCLPTALGGHGRLRHPRWCAGILREEVPDMPLLDVDLPWAEELETWLVEQRPLAPASGAKVISHLLALRSRIAERLGQPQLPEAGSPRTWRPQETEVTIEDFSRTRRQLTHLSMVAATLIAACRLPAAAVLSLRSRDVGPGGATIRVGPRGRRVELLVPAFLRDDLNQVAMAAASSPDRPLFPGRLAGQPLRPPTLRRHVQEASMRALGRQVDLRALGRLAAEILGPASGTPVGRRAALQRIADDWYAVGCPPRRPAEAGDPRRRAGPEPRSQLEGELETLKEELRTARQTVGNLQENSARMRNGVAAMRRQLDARIDSLFGVVGALESLHNSHVAASRLDDDRGVDAGARKVLRKHGKAIRLLKRDSDFHLGRYATTGEVKAIDARLDEAEKQLRRTRNAVAGQVVWLVGRELAEAGMLRRDVLEKIGRSITALEDAGADAAESASPSLKRLLSTLPRWPGDDDHGPWSDS